MILSVPEVRKKADLITEKGNNRKVPPTCGSRAAIRKRKGHPVQIRVVSELRIPAVNRYCAPARTLSGEGPFVQTLVY